MKTQLIGNKSFPCLINRRTLISRSFSLPHLWPFQLSPTLLESCNHGLTVCNLLPLPVLCKCIRFVLQYAQPLPSVQYRTLPQFTLLWSSISLTQRPSSRISRLCWGCVVWFESHYMMIELLRLHYGKGAYDGIVRGRGEFDFPQLVWWHAKDVLIGQAPRRIDREGRKLHFTLDLGLKQLNLVGQKNCQYSGFESWATLGKAHQVVPGQEKCQG